MRLLLTSLFVLVAVAVSGFHGLLAPATGVLAGAPAGLIWLDPGASWAVPLPPRASAGST